MKDKYSDQHYKIAKDEFDSNYRLRDKFESEMEEHLSDIMDAPVFKPVFTKEKLISSLQSNIDSVKSLMSLGHFIYRTEKDKQQGLERIKRWEQEIRKLEGQK
jgi:hypothetical protein